MAFQAHGSFSEFSSSQKTWTVYVEHLEQYLAANKIEDADQQRAILLSVCGPALIGLFAAWCHPKSLQNSNSKTLQKLSRSTMIQSPLSSCNIIISILVIVMLENQSQHMSQSFANSQIIVILALTCSRCYETHLFVALRTLKYSGDCWLSLT